MVIRLFTMVALWGVAAWHRLRVLDHAAVGSDSLGPYLQAKAALFGHLPRPPNPESGDALWITMLPVVAAADSLLDAFSIRFVLGGLIAPIGFAAAFHWTAESAPAARRWAAALTAGSLLAFDPGLLDTLISGARSYAAPEFVGIFTVGLALALRGIPWAPALSIISLVFAAGHHPLALGAGVSLLPFLRTLHRIHGGRRLRNAFLLGGFVALPRIVRIANIAMCGEGFRKCLSSVAGSNITDPEPVRLMLSTALHDRFAVDFKGTLFILIVGAVLALLCRKRDHRWAAVFAAMALTGLLGLGAVNGYIRSYHLRIIAVPVAVVSALGLARVWPMAAVAATAFITTHFNHLPVGSDPGSLARHVAIANRLPSGPLWVDRVWWDGPPRLEASAVVLSAWMAGRRDFRLDRTIPFVLLNVADDPTMPTVKQFPTASAAGRWVDAQDPVRPYLRGGAYDWATIAHPQTTLEDARW